MDIKKLKIIDDVEYLFDINLDKYTTIKLGNLGSIAICKSVSALKKLLEELNEKSINYHLVGWGANQVLLNSNGTLFIKLDFKLDKEIFKSPKDKYELPASTPLNILTSHAMKFGLKGWEVFTGIPGSLGGSIFMNAGTALGEIGELIESVTILKKNGEIYTYSPSTTSFSYRKNHFVGDGEIIISAVIKHKGLDQEIKSIIKDYLEYRKSTQPLTTKNCGSVFKNFSKNFKAGQTIDTIGLKKFGFENLQVSSKHANFVENYGNAKAEQFKMLVECLKIDIERYSGHKFELEVNLY